MADSKRQYPTPCTSQFCGEIKCPSDCKYKPLLDAYERYAESSGVNKQFLDEKVIFAVVR